VRKTRTRDHCESIGLSVAVTQKTKKLTHREEPSGCLCLYPSVVDIMTAFIRKAAPSGHGHRLYSNADRFGVGGS
jgi:hypothetical protein